MTARPGWCVWLEDPRRQALLVFGLAAALRLAFVFASPPGLVYSSSFQYFTAALEIVEHPQPLDWLMHSDGWRLWRQEWTVAPLYPAWLAAVFSLGGLRLAQVLQALLDGGVALGVLALARAAGPRFALPAALAYACSWQALELSRETLTENLHTPLLVLGLAALARAPRSARWAIAGGAALALSALARAVTLLFLPVAAVWLCWTAGGRAGRRRAGLFAAAAVLTLLPWTLRTLAQSGELVPIETVSSYNLWSDTAFVGEAERARQEEQILSQPTPAAQRSLATRLAAQNLLRDPAAWLDKAETSLRHLFRPEGLHLLLVAEQPATAVGSVGRLLLQDLPLLAAAGLAVAGLAAAGLAGGPVVALLRLWTLYYVGLIVGVFHSEVRYRSALVPLLLALAAGSLEPWRAAPPRRRRLAGALAVAVLLPVVWTYVTPGAAFLQSLPALWRLRQATARSDWQAARAAAWESSARSPRSARPWLALGSALAGAGHLEEAIQAHQEAARRNPANWLPQATLPALLRAAGRADEADRAYSEARRAFGRTSDWQSLEAAWRALPPPLTDELVLGRDEFGAARGFVGGRGRWTQDRAELRLRPRTLAGSYRVTLVAGSPDPSPLPRPWIEVRSGGQSWRFQLARESRALELTVAAPAAGAPLTVEIRSPTWNLAHQPPEQGVRVERLSVAPL